MEDNKDIFYTSYSMMETYKTCPQQYQYRYIDKLESKSKKRALYIGTHIHKLVELFYIQRRPDLVDARVKAYNDFMSDGLNQQKINFLAHKKIKELEDLVNFETEVKKQEYQDLIAEMGIATEEDFINLVKDTIKARNTCNEMLFDTFTWREYLVSAIKQDYMQLSETDKAEMGLTYLEDLARIMGQYEYYYGSDKMKILDLEHKKYCQFGNYNNKQVVLNYICDGDIELIDGNEYILEHKSFKDTPMTFEKTWLNTQTAVYVSALNAQGHNIKGVLWDNIKSEAPKKPNILKNGSYGKQTGNVTLFSFIDVNTIMEGPAEVAEAIANLPQEVLDLGVQENYNNFLSRHMTVFNDNVVDIVLKDSSAVLSEITKDKPLIYRNMGWTCNNCPYKELCQAEMLGQDVETLKSILFKCNKK